MGKKSKNKAQARERQHPAQAGHSTTRNARREIADDTLNLLNQGWYLSKEVEGEQQVISIAAEQEQAQLNTVLWTPEMTDKLLAEHKQKASDDRETEIIINNMTTLDAVRDLILQQGEANVFCLNFASGKNAGGGFLNGSQAQEESIARASGLYPCQIQQSVRGYYTSNQAARAPFYTDHLIYSPNVPVFKLEDGSVMDPPIQVSFLTAPAVNKGPADEDELQQVEAVMRQRIAKVLAVAQKQGHDCLVLGAWGCGVFGNEPKDVAQWFREGLRSFQFRKVVFAIYSPNHPSAALRAFFWEFKRCGVEEEDAEDDDGSNKEDTKAENDA